MGHFLLSICFGYSKPTIDHPIEGPVASLCLLNLFMALNVKDYVAICLTLLVEQALIMTKFSMGWVENTSISKIICMLNVR
jgi:hypothetical protein